MSKHTEVIASLRETIEKLRVKALDPTYEPQRFEVLMCISVIELLIAFAEELLEEREDDGPSEEEFEAFADAAGFKVDGDKV